MDEFVEKEKPSQTQQSLQPFEKGKAREADDTDPFVPTYLYDAMKEKRLFKNMLVVTVVRSCAHDPPFYY